MISVLKTATVTMANATIASIRAANQIEPLHNLSKEIRTQTMGFRTGFRSARDQRRVLCVLGFAINVKIVTFIVHIVQVI